MKKILYVAPSHKTKLYHRKTDVLPLHRVCQTAGVP